MNKLQFTTNLNDEESTMEQDRFILKIGTPTKSELANEKRAKRNAFKKELNELEKTQAEWVLDVLKDCPDEDGEQPPILNIVFLEDIAEIVGPCRYCYIARHEMDCTLIDSPIGRLKLIIRADLRKGVEESVKIVTFIRSYDENNDSAISIAASLVTDLHSQDCFQTEDRILNEVRSVLKKTESFLAGFKPLANFKFKGKKR